MKDALERAVHRKNQVEQLKDQLEEEVRFCNTARLSHAYGRKVAVPGMVLSRS